jgi:hypothetical protein
MSKSNNIKPQQWFSLDEEIHTSIRLLQLGIKELSEISFANDFYHLPLLLLSSGFERLMKCMICLKYLDENGEFPTINKIKSFGHNLEELKKKIISNCISEKTAFERPATKKDYEFLVGDKDLEKLIKILSDFGKNARYHNLNVIGGEIDPTSDIKTRLEEFEIQLLKEKYKDRPKKFEELLTDPNKNDDFYKEIYAMIIPKIQRFARALVRQFTLGDLGKEARRYSGLLKPFLYLRDEELGIKSYTI